MRTHGYVVAILNENDVPYKFFDGREYTDNFRNIRLFSQGEAAIARSEQGNHQRLIPTQEVRLIKFEIELPFDEPKLTEEPTKPTSVATSVLANDTLGA